MVSMFLQSLQNLKTNETTFGHAISVRVQRSRCMNTKPAQISFSISQEVIALIFNLTITTASSLPTNSL